MLKNVNKLSDTRSACKSDIDGLTAWLITCNDLEKIESKWMRATKRDVGIIKFDSWVENQCINQYTCRDQMALYDDHRSVSRKQPRTVDLDAGNQRRSTPSDTNSKMNTSRSPATSGTGSIAGAGMPSTKSRTMLAEAVDAVVNSFAKHTRGYGRGN